MIWSFFFWIYIYIHLYIYILIEQMVVVMAGDDGDEQRTEFARLDGVEWRTLLDVCGRLLALLV